MGSVAAGTGAARPGFSAQQAARRGGAALRSGPRAALEDETRARRLYSGAMARLTSKPLIPEAGLNKPETPRVPGNLARTLEGEAAEPARRAPRPLLAAQPLGGQGAETGPETGPEKGAAPRPAPQPTPVRRASAAPRSRASAAAFDPPPRAQPSAPRNHNQGPPLHGGFAVFAWRKAQKKAWATPPLEVLRRRVKLAAECGLTLREYTLEIMERGRWLTPEKDAQRIARIIAERG